MDTGMYVTDIMLIHKGTQVKCYLVVSLLDIPENIDKHVDSD